MREHNNNIPEGSPQQWLRLAESDLALGKLGRESPDILPEQVCFHAQQAIEKAIKGLMVHLHIRFPPVHDLEQLLEILRQAKMSLPEWSDELLEVTPYAVQTRYPGDWEEISLAERDKAIELAGMTLSWVRSKLQSEESQD